MLSAIPQGSPLYTEQHERYTLLNQIEGVECDFETYEAHAGLLRVKIDGIKIDYENSDWKEILSGAHIKTLRMDDCWFNALDLRFLQDVCSLEYLNIARNPKMRLLPGYDGSHESAKRSEERRVG